MVIAGFVGPLVGSVVVVGGDAVVLVVGEIDGVGVGSIEDVSTIELQTTEQLAEVVASIGT